MENGAHPAPGMVGIAWFVPNFHNLGAKLLRVVLCGFTMKSDGVAQLVGLEAGAPVTKVGAGSIPATICGIGTAP